MILWNFFLCTFAHGWPRRRSRSTGGTENSSRSPCRCTEQRATRKRDEGQQRRRVLLSCLVSLARLCIFGTYCPGGREIWVTRSSYFIWRFSCHAARVYNMLRTAHTPTADTKYFNIQFACTVFNNEVVIFFIFIFATAVRRVIISEKLLSRAIVT